METFTIYMDSHAIWLVALASGLVAATVNTVVLAALTYGMGVISADKKRPGRQNTATPKSRKGKVGSEQTKTGVTKARRSKRSINSAVTPVVSPTEAATRVLKVGGVR